MGIQGGGESLSILIGSSHLTKSSPLPLTKDGIVIMYYYHFGHIRYLVPVFSSYEIRGKRVKSFYDQELHRINNSAIKEKGVFENGKGEGEDKATARQGNRATARRRGRDSGGDYYSGYRQGETDGR